MSILRLSIINHDASSSKEVRELNVFDNKIVLKRVVSYVGTEHKVMFELPYNVLHPIQGIFHKSLL